jgi:hypothetical protein
VFPSRCLAFDATPDAKLNGQVSAKVSATSGKAPSVSPRVATGMRTRVTPALPRGAAYVIKLPFAFHACLP